MEAGSLLDGWRATLESSHRTWALVMTPTRARILRGLSRTAAGPAELVMHTRAPRLRALMAGQPGHGMTALAEDDREFVEQVCLFLDAHRRAGEFDGLVLCAAPGVLAMLGRCLSPPLRSRVVAEVPRDLLHLSEADLQRALRQAMEKDSGPER